MTKIMKGSILIYFTEPKTLVLKKMHAIGLYIQSLTYMLHLGILLLLILLILLFKNLHVLLHMQDNDHCNKRRNHSKKKIILKKKSNFCD